MPDDGKDALAHRHGVAAFNDGRRDAETAGLLGERSLHKADQVDILRAVQALQQGKNVRFRAADIAAGDQMDEFHTVIPQNGQITLASCNSMANLIESACLNIHYNIFCGKKQSDFSRFFRQLEVIL